jgi:SAM-dependent methyltransferase
LLELGPGQRCLDVGCGTGEDARAICEMSGAEVVGIDVQPRMAAEAKTRSADRPGVTFLAADARRLPFLDSTFDAAWVKRALMHLATPADAMREMARVVRRGGRAVAVEPDLEVVLLDSALVDVTRRLLALHASGYANPWAGWSRSGGCRMALATTQAIEKPRTIDDLPAVATTRDHHVALRDGHLELQAAAIGDGERGHGDDLRPNRARRQVFQLDPGSDRCAAWLERARHRRTGCLLAERDHAWRCEPRHVAGPHRGRGVRLRNRQPNVCAAFARHRTVLLGPRAHSRVRWTSGTDRAASRGLVRPERPGPRRRPTSTRLG